MLVLFYLKVTRPGHTYLHHHETKTSIRTLDSNSKAITMSKAKQQNYEDNKDRTKQTEQTKETKETKEKDQKERTQKTKKDKKKQACKQKEREAKLN